MAMHSAQFLTYIVILRFQELSITYTDLRTIDLDSAYQLGVECFLLCNSNRLMYV